MSANQPIAFETPFFFIERLGGNEKGKEPHYRLSGPDSAIVLVFNEQAEILLVRQFRPTLGETTLEFPAGAIEPNEEPMVAAQREVLEETGYQSELFQLGDYFHLMMNRTGIRDYLFCGMVKEEQQRSLPEEGIDHEWVSRERFVHLAFQGGYRQLAGLGILQLSGAALGIDAIHVSRRELLLKLHARLTDRDRDG